MQPGRRLRAERALQRRHASARHHRLHAGVRRRSGARSCSSSPARGHHADIGGIAPGSMTPRATHIEEEGVYIDNFKLVDGGRFREAETGRAADRRTLPGAQLGAEHRRPQGADRRQREGRGASCGKMVGALRARRGAGLYGPRAGQRRRERAPRARRSCTTASFAYRDGPGRAHQGEDHRRPRQRARRRSTSPAPRRSAPTTSTRPSRSRAPRCSMSSACMVDDDIPMNAGCLRPINIIIPEGSMLAPRYPAAVVAGNVETSQPVTNCLFGALGAHGLGAGHDEQPHLRQRRVPVLRDDLLGLAGRRPGFDGTPGVHTHMTNSRLTDPEILELRFPVLLEDFHIRARLRRQGQVDAPATARSRTHPLPRGDGLRHPRPSHRKRAARSASTAASRASSARNAVRRARRPHRGARRAATRPCSKPGEAVIVDHADRRRLRRQARRGMSREPRSASLPSHRRRRARSERVEAARAAGSTGSSISGSPSRPVAVARGLGEHQAGCRSGLTEGYRRVGGVGGRAASPAARRTAVQARLELDDRACRSPGPAVAREVDVEVVVVQRVRARREHGGEDAGTSRRKPRAGIPARLRCPRQPFSTLISRPSARRKAITSMALPKACSDVDPPARLLTPRQEYEPARSSATGSAVVERGGGLHDLGEPSRRRPGAWGRRGWPVLVRPTGSIARSAETRNG